MATSYGMTGARQVASGYALSASPRIKNLHHFLGHHLPPAEAEANHYRQLASQSSMVAD